MRTTSEGRDANRAAVDVTEAAGRIALLMDTKFTRGLLDDVDELAAEVARLKAQLASTEESIRAMQAKNDGREGGHGCGCGGY